VPFDQLNAGSPYIEVPPQHQRVKGGECVNQQSGRTRISLRGGKERERAHQRNQDERADQANHA
jgi:hypothetical protein